jgi:phosphate transport system permease protein
MAAVTTPARTTAAAQEWLRSSGPRTRKERTFQWTLILATAVAIVVLAVLLVDILLDGFSGLSSALLFNYTSRFPEEAGIRAGITGTISLMVLVAALSFPIGVGAGLYLEEFAPSNRFTRLIEVNISNLAGVPSIVYGLLGAGVFVYFFAMGPSLLAGAITLTLLILPVIIVATREALRAVPQDIRMGALGLGATPLQTAFRQTLPAAIPGTLTGTILALSRAIGETAPLIAVGAVFRRATNSPLDPSEAFNALPFQIYSWTTLPQQEFQDLAASAIIVLLVLLLAMNSLAIYLRNRYSGS